MFGLIFIDSFFVCVTCFPCCKMSMFFPHVPKVPLPIHITPHEIIIHCFKTNILFCIPMSLAKKRTKHVFFLCALYLCSKMISYTCISSVQLLSHIWLFATPWTAAWQASLFITNYILCMLCEATSIMFNSFWPHGLYPARLHCPWDSPGKNTGVGCHRYS